MFRCQFLAFGPCACALATKRIFSLEGVNRRKLLGVAGMDANRLHEGLSTKHIGRSVVFSRVVSSTNDLAKKLATLGAVHGAVIVAESQTRGHGRLNREWISPPGGLWFSTILRPGFKPSDASRLVFVAGLAVAKTLRELYGLNVATKWPNDVLVNGKKVCGILAEMNTAGQRINYVVLGIGINADFEVEALPEVLRRNVTTLKTELGREIDLEQLFRALLEELENAYDLFTSQGSAVILKEWKSFACFLGSQVEVVSASEKSAGLALDVNGDGSLILRLEDGSTKRVLVGDFSVQAE